MEMCTVDSIIFMVTNYMNYRLLNKTCIFDFVVLHRSFKRIRNSFNIRIIGSPLPMKIGI